MNAYIKGGLLILLVALAVGAKQFYFTETSPIQYLTTEAVIGDIRETVLATGTLQAFQQVSVGAQASGQIKSLKVKLGDSVKRGDIIAEIDSQEQYNAFRIAQAALTNVKAQREAKLATLAQAQSEFDRYKALLDASATSRQEYENELATLTEIKANIAALDALIVQAEIEVETSKVDLGYTSIVAPMDGVVVAVVATEGQTVNASQSTPTIVKLAQLDTMTVEAEISEADVVHVSPGCAVYFTILGEPDVKYEAKLRSIEPAPESIENDDSGSSTSEDEAVYYNALFDVPNPERKLRISMTAEVTFVLNEARNALTIPETALGTKDDQGRYDVLVLRLNGQAETRNVRVGLRDSVKAQISDGLQAGERVVLGQADVKAALAQESTRHRRPMSF